MKMERSTRNCVTDENKPLELSTAAKCGKSMIGKCNVNATTFFNHGAKMWLENRKKWVGDKSRQRKTSKDPIISWSTAYEDLLSTHEPFSQPIPLPEMVDFLVDIWYDEGLYD